MIYVRNSTNVIYKQDWRGEVNSDEVIKVRIQYKYTWKSVPQGMVHSAATVTSWKRVIL